MAALMLVQHSSWYKLEQHCIEIDPVCCSERKTSRKRWWTNNFLHCVL